MSDIAVLEAIADALDAASATLRQRVALLKPVGPSEARGPAGAVARARALHPQLGERQAQILEILAAAGAEGTGTGPISHQIDYDQPNVYLTLQSLVRLRFVEKDDTSDPHRYRLTGLLGD